MNGLIQRRKRRHKEHSEGYWPGYVDALTNVVLNLLFLVAILAAGVFSLGMEASRKAALAGIAALQSRVEQVVSGHAAKSIVVSKPAQAPDGLHVTLDAVRYEGGRLLFQISFSGDAVVLGAADKAVLLPQIQTEIRQLDHPSLAVWAVSDGDPGNQRASFMRVMAVRDLLGEAGLDLSQVVTRILPGASSDQRRQRVYLLMNRKGTSDVKE